MFTVWHAMLNSSIFSMHQNQMASSAERQSNDSKFQTEAALTLKVFAENASAA